MSQAKTLLPGKPYFDKEDAFKEQKLLTSISFPICFQKVRHSLSLDTSSSDPHIHI